MEKMNAKQLNDLCRTYNVTGWCTSGRDLHKIIPRAVGAGLNSGQLQQFESLTPALLYGLQDCSSDLTQENMRPALVQFLMTSLLKK